MCVADFFSGYAILIQQRQKKNIFHLMGIKHLAIHVPTSKELSLVLILYMLTMGRFNGA